MTLKFPRPCSYADLTRMSGSDKLPELALIADGPPQTLAEAVGAWRSVVPHTRLSIFYTSEYTDAVRTLKDAEAVVKTRVIPSYRELGHDPSASACRVWASCAPYDAYGVLVKKPVESALYRVLRQNQGVYFAHDPEFGFVRWFEANGLRDRLHQRIVRLFLYQLICRMVLALARVSCRVSEFEFRWRKI